MKFFLTSENEFDKILEKPGQKDTFFSDSGGITINDEKLTSFSLTGHVLWQKDLANVSNVSYSNKSLNELFHSW